MSLLDSNNLFLRSNKKSEKKNIFLEDLNINNLQKKIKSKSIFLLNESFNLLELIPRLFTITTNSGCAKFNTYLLKQTSSVISKFIEENPDHLLYHLDIDDNENILGKIEQMYQGKFVAFEEDELHILQKITKLLNLISCPNFMKPESLKTHEYKFPASPDTKFSVEINYQYLVQILQEKSPGIFTIVTNKSEYQCNLFGVYSSSVIRQLLTKDPTIEKYVYNFEDEFNEFQLISDAFNFKFVTLTKDNMDIIKEISGELEITPILTEVENYIETLEKVSQTIDEQQTIIDSIDELFELLYNIKEITVSTVKESILSSNWSKTEDKVKELTAFILQAVKTDFSLHPYLVDLLIQLDQEANDKNKLDILMDFFVKQLILITFIHPRPRVSEERRFYYSSILNNKINLDYLMDDFSKSENLMAYYAFVYILYKKGIIKKDELYSNIKQTYKNSSFYLRAWFYPELNEIFPKFTNSSSYGEIINENALKDFLYSYQPDRIEDYKKMRDSGEPDDELTLALRKDDIDTVQRIISSRNSDFTEQIVPFNIFENFVLNGKTRYINYAAAYGSIKCFKYFLLNHDEIDKFTFPYAVFGGNYEIIKIVDQNNHNFDYSNLLIPSIIKHQNNLFDWILEQKFSDKSQNNDLLGLIFQSACNGDAHSLIGFIDKGFNLSENKEAAQCLIQASALNGFYMLTQLLCNISGEEIIKTIKFDPIVLIFDNISILSCFKPTNFLHDSFNDLNISLHYQGNTILYALEHNLTSIIYYFSELIDKNIFSLNSNGILRLLSQALDNDNKQIFRYLLNLIVLKKDSFLSFNDLYLLYIRVCGTNNFESSKQIIDLMFKENPNYNFTHCFEEAASKSDNEICKYLMDKKVPICYEELSEKVNKFSAFDVELFSTIIKNIGPEGKLNSIQCLIPAIIDKNKNLVKYLLKDYNPKPPFDDSLIQAVNTNDLEFVEIILNHNSQPSFINQLFDEGTALSIAAQNNNLQIVKKLLSIPGINPSLYSRNRNDNKKLKTPLMIAIINTNLEITNEILNFYGENIQKQKWQIYHALNILLNEIEKNNPDANKLTSKEEIIIKRLIEIKNFDHNFFNDYDTLLTFACKKNSYKLVQCLLNYDDIDVNMYDINAQTPLLIACDSNNIEIVKILIEHPQIDINWIDYETQSALTNAVLLNNESIVDLLINNDKFDPIKSNIDLSFYESEGKIAKKLASFKELDVNYEREKKTTLLKEVYLHNIEKIDLILHHPSFDKVKSRFNKAIIASYMNNKTDIYEKLMNFINNDYNSVNLNRKNILYYSVIKLDEDMVEEILNDPNLDSQKSGILISFIQSFTKYDSYILNDFDFDDREIKNQSPIPIMKKLYEYDEKHDHLIDLTNIDIFSKLQNIRSNFLREIVDFFLQNGADPNIPTHKGIYPLQVAIENKSIEVINALIESNLVDYSKKIQIGSSKCSSYLHLAASKNAQILKIFLDNELIDINITNEFGETPLMMACKAKNKECVDILFNDDKLDFLHLNNDGNDALAILNQNSNTKDKNEYHDLILKAFSNKNDVNNLNRTNQFVHFNSPIEKMSKKDKDNKTIYPNPSTSDQNKPIENVNNSDSESNKSTEKSKNSERSSNDSNKPA